jgi:hypothetical protein
MASILMTLTSLKSTRESKTSYYFLDPSNSYRLVGKALENEILATDPFRDRYLKKRDKLTEAFGADRFRSIFPDAEIHQNYYVEKGQLEKDILVRHGDTVILIECKNSRVRGFAGGGDDLIKYDTDFEKSVQYAYDQALDVKQRIGHEDETVFYDDKGREAFRLRRLEVKRFFIVCGLPDVLYQRDCWCSAADELVSPPPPGAWKSGKRSLLSTFPCPLLVFSCHAAGAGGR